MAIRRRTDWRPGSSGHYERVLGLKNKPSDHWEDPKPTKVEFRLGRDEDQARQRADRLEQVWSRIEERAARDGVAPRWDATSLDVAKAVAKGEKTFPLPMLKYGNGQLYLDTVFRLMSDFGGVIQILPEDLKLFHEGVAGEQQKIDHHQKRIESHRTKLATVGVKAVPSGGPTFHEALERFKVYIGEDPKLRNPATGEYKAWYYKRIGIVDSLKERHADFPLVLFDLEKVEEIIRYWRGRPPVKTRGNVMSVEVAIKSIEEFKRFCRWLHRSKLYGWRKPEDFDDIDCSVHELPDELAARAVTEQVDTFNQDELKKILPFTSDVMRATFLLGINCGFGGGECGTLTMGEIFLHQAHPRANRIGWRSTQEDSFIRRIRRKNTVYGEHWLWPETVAALEWLIQRRRKQGNVKPDSLLFTTEDGGPIWHLTAGGNSGQQIRNMWATVMQAVIAKHPEVRNLSLGKLRKTAGDMIREVAGGEVNGVFLCHGKPVKSDELSDVYTNRPWKKVFAAQETARERFGLFSST